MALALEAALANLGADDTLTRVQATTDLSTVPDDARPRVAALLRESIPAHLHDHQEVPDAWFDDDCRPSQAAESALRQIGTPEAQAFLVTPRPPVVPAIPLDSTGGA